MADCTVYQDTANTYAKNGAGTIISQVTRSSLTDHVPINAAIVAGTGVKFVGTGSYTVNLPVFVESKSNFILDFNGATINAGTAISGDHSIFADPRSAHNCLVSITRCSYVTVKNAILDAKMNLSSNGIKVDNEGTGNRGSSNHITISGIEIKNCAIWNVGDAVATVDHGGRGIHSMDATYVTVDNCNVHDCANGIEFGSPTTAVVNNTISNCTITNCLSQRGHIGWDTNFAGLGIYVYAANNVAVRNCTLSGMIEYAAVYIGEAPEGIAQDLFTIEDSTMSNSLYGFNVGGVYTNVGVHRCTFSHNTNGINHIDYGEVTGCTFMNNVRAINCDGGSIPTSTAYIVTNISGNTFADNTYAYYHVSNYFNNNRIGISFTNNILERNVDPLYIVSFAGSTIAVTTSGNINYGFLDNTTTVSKTTPALNETITCTATVKNTGTTSDTFKVVFTQQGVTTPLYTSPAQAIASGATVSIPMAFNCIAVGSINICSEAISTLAIYP